ncbi:uncharacterized protein LOC106156104 [Lingula anatina]|uniref:Uncharacterized protein LOC106156104 n=1 Tax=Lingula anatina TaxID=7574 RepID=A0A1S3HME6_LINAN|nr:uncharacterized protein LOC106156104 [Lingula anatina]|eukprot:XP_013386671.1 uncharacterized protein LOC106156104 [Lingula anatina]
MNIAQNATRWALLRRLVNCRENASLFFSARTQTNRAIHTEYIQPLVRSVYFPSLQAIKSGQIPEINPDIVVLDMEDTVPMAEKDCARPLFLKIIESWHRPQPLFVRLNCADDYLLMLKDANTLSHINVAGFVLPKVQRGSAFEEYEVVVREQESRLKLPLGTFRYIPMIETAEGYANAFSIASGGFGRNFAVAIGNNDISFDTQSEPLSSLIQTLRNQVTFAAKSGNIPVLWGVHLNEDDYGTFERICLEAKASGCDGGIALSPAHVTILNRVFSTSPSEAEDARMRVDFKKSNPGVSYHRYPQSTRTILALPLVKKAENILERIEKERLYDAEKKKGIRNDRDDFETPASVTIPSRVPEIFPGGEPKFNTWEKEQTIVAPFELTIDGAMMTLWDSSFYQNSLLCSSDEFSKSCGLAARQLPLGLLGMVAIGMSVSTFTEHCRYHLGFKNLRQLHPMSPGVTVRAVMSVLDVRRAGNEGKYDVVTSRHELTDTSGISLLSVDKISMFPQGMFPKIQPSAETKSETSAVKVISKLKRTVVDGAKDCSKCPFHEAAAVEVGKVYAHRLVKVLTDAESRGLSHLMWLTNPHHFNIMRFSHAEIVVPGPFVMAATIANTGLDYGYVMYEEITSCTNPNRVNVGDMISSLSCVTEVKAVDGNPDLEELTMRLYGLINIDTEDILHINVPGDVLEKEDFKASEMEEILRVNCPALFHKVACIMTRKMIRFSPSSEIS